MRIFDEMKKIFNPYEDEDDYEEGFDDQDVSPFVDDRDRRSDRDRDRDRDRRNTSSFDERRNKVVNIAATTQLKVVLVKPERFEMASEIADHLKEKRTVSSTWSPPIRTSPGGSSTSSPAWPMPARGASRKSLPTPISSPPITWKWWGICWTNWKTTACIFKRRTRG